MKGTAMSQEYDIAIVGGGPGGYLAALRGAQLGKRVVLFEEDRIGGTCMNYGCIPTKYLLHQTKILKELKANKKIRGPVSDISLNWAEVQKERQAVADRLVRGIEFLLKKGRVETAKASARLVDDRRLAVRLGDEERLFEAGAIVLATGSRSASLPFLKPDGKRVVTSREALEFADIPRSLLVVGAGAIGLELGSVYQRLGSDVTILEIMPTIMPGSEKEMAARLERILKKQGLKIFTQMRIEKAQVEPGRVVLRGTGLGTRAPFAYEAEKVLLAAGRRANSDLFGDGGGPGLNLDRSGFIRVDAALKTNVPNVYAIGDVIGGRLLAHKAYHDALVALENIAGGQKTVDYAALPMAVFTEPEFASVGLTEDEARERESKVQVGLFPLQASGRALTMDAADGAVKLIADSRDELIGGHIVAPGASELIAEITLAVERKMKLQEVASLIHIHPTLSETVGEAALKARNRALHIINS
jgi:dihydrolipoamide dehydrogenase